MNYNVRLHANHLQLWLVALGGHGACSFASLMMIPAGKLVTVGIALSFVCGGALYNGMQDKH